MNVSEKNILVIKPNDVLTKQIETLIFDYPVLIKTLDSFEDILPIIQHQQVDAIISEIGNSDTDKAIFYQDNSEILQILIQKSIPAIFVSSHNNGHNSGHFHFIQMHQTDQLEDALFEIMHNEAVTSKTSELKKRVRKSEYQYRDLLENANDFIFTLDEFGLFTYLNNRFSPLTGYDKNTWVNKSFIDLIQEKDRESVQNHYDLAHQGKARIFEARIKTAQNRTMIVSFSVTPIFEKGHIIGSMGIGRDVTETKKLEKEILELKNFNESIIQSMEAGLLTIDLDENITSLNSGGEKILGWKSSECVGMSIRNRVPSEEVDLLLIKSASPNSRRFSREMEITNKENHSISIGYTTTDWLDNRGQKMGMIISFRDISQIKQMQNEVIRMDRLASLGVLASGIAHEIKNPLAGIKTMAQACEEEFEPDDSKREYLTRIVRQVNRLDGLLKTFFTYAKPNPPNRCMHSLPDILNEVLNLVKTKMQKSNVIYTENFDDDLPNIHVDAHQLQQVFLNLLLNAIDAMPDGGQLEVTAWKKGDLLDCQEIEIFVTDTGSGIPVHKLETIFDPFFTTKSNGLGLGLSIVYRIIQSHQGDIYVESQENKGTRFMITLPIGEN